MNKLLLVLLFGLPGASALAQISLPVPAGGVSGPAKSPTGALAPGLYVQVIDGLINVSNRGGTTAFAAGQFGYTQNFQQPPVIVPKNPGIQFSPPPAFNSSSGPQSNTSTGNKSNAVDCEVR
jgi:hypothetical protein